MLWLAPSLLGIALVAIVLWPGRGILARWRARRELARRTRREDALKHILKEEVNAGAASLASVAGALHIAENDAAVLLAELERDGLVTFVGRAPRLQPAGRELAQHVVRAHRVWESFLADQTGVSEADWHRYAERHEHLLTPAEVDRLASQLGDPLRDPHGDVIPAGGEAVAADLGQPLAQMGLGQRFSIVHLEDEPDAVYRHLIAAGLRNGLSGEVVGRTGDTLDLRVGPEGRPMRLNAVEAANVAVAPQTTTPTADVTLRELRRGQRAEVVGLSAACHGAARRRLLDLGFVPGTAVSLELSSPLGDPTAYRVRGTVVALRASQAGLVEVRLVPGGEA
jgi:DtxR family Mn-dependent transcriptional regulator